MQLKLNGKDLEVNNIKTLTDLVEDKKLKPESIAISYNGDIIFRDDWAKIVQSRDSIHDKISLKTFSPE